MTKDGLPGKLRTLCRYLALATIVWLIHDSHQAFLRELRDKGQPITLAEAKGHFPRAAKLEDDPDDPSLARVLDANGTPSTKGEEPRIRWRE